MATATAADPAPSFSTPSPACLLSGRCGGATAVRQQIPAAGQIHPSSPLRSPWRTAATSLPPFIDDTSPLPPVAATHRRCIHHLHPQSGGGPATATAPAPTFFRPAAGSTTPAATPTLAATTPRRRGATTRPRRRASPPPVRGQGLPDMAQQQWGVDGYGSMKGLIHLRASSPRHPGEGEGDGEGDDHCSSGNDIEVERGLSYFEMVYPSGMRNGGYAFEDLDDEYDQDVHLWRLEEENLTLKERLFL